MMNGPCIYSFLRRTLRTWQVAVGMGVEGNEWWREGAVIGGDVWPAGSHASQSQRAGKVGCAGHMPASLREHEPSVNRKYGREYP